MSGYILSMRNLLDLSWLIFLLVIGVYFLRCRQQIVKTKQWTTTQGRITHFEWLVGDQQLWPKIEYVYQVDGIDYTNERIIFDTRHIHPSSVYARMLAYKIAMASQKNQLLTVNYNPNNPSEAVLDTTIPPKLNFILLFITGLIGLHIAIVSYRWLQG